MGKRATHRMNVLIALAFLAGCTSSSVTQTARNSALISTTAAPICGTSGAISVANQMAAIATIKQGYSRFIIGSAGAQNNTHVISSGPTFATTTGTFNRFGNTVYGSSNSVYGGQQTHIAGSNDAQMQVLMFNPGDSGFENALDARATLGTEWEKKVKDGINTCFSK